MGYNTRRKSLSLPSLGIQLPHTSRASNHRSPPAIAPGDQPPSKKVKRSHSSTSPPPTANAPASAIAVGGGPSESRGRAYQHTPPPSPGEIKESKIDTEGIQDEVVRGVIELLEKTGNRPHLAKELGTVLSNSSKAVERYGRSLRRADDSVPSGSQSGIADRLSSSANPAGMISSRLTVYLRRPWTALSPCPLAKTFSTSHPRRTYFFLTTTPHQPIPEISGASSNPRIISPSLSSADEEEERDARTRAALSPSPEIDLSSPELDDDDSTSTADGSFSGRSSLARDGTHAPTSLNISHNHRAASPPLEGDEREFTQTASSMQKRSMSRENDTPNNGQPIESTEGESQLETEESVAMRNSEAAAALFGHTHAGTAHVTFSSPVIKPNTLHLPISAKKPVLDTDILDMDLPMKSLDNVSILEEHGFSGWGSEMNPENIELEELDDLLGGF
ncbi:MAG: hypothetical protein M1819_003929 [Sarea resinae]|nr:MAG: hypothetical protein M1819_003929 [Sarea resinae]